MRESRDSATHPTTKAVAILQDVTGSLNQVPEIVRDALPKLMGLLIRKGYLEHPHILIGGIGDAEPDRNGGPPDTMPLQISQFEAGIEIDEAISNLFLEGDGGGQKYESHDLAMYYMARHTAMDCLEKRGEKGYLFIITDEMCRPVVKKALVEKLIGDKLESDIPIEDIVKELEAKFEVYVIIPNMTTYYGDREVFDSWTKLLTNAVIKLEEPSGITELIATQIGIAEGKTDVTRVKDDLHEVGTELSVAGAVTDALIKSGAKAGEATGALAVADSGEPGGLAQV
jgi:hypothetical protein